MCLQIREFLYLLTLRFVTEFVSTLGDFISLFTKQLMADGQLSLSFDGDFVIYLKDSNA